MNVQQIKRRYGIVGNDPALNSAVEIAMQVAPTDVSVLVYGENGTGKDVFSRVIHDNSKRKHKQLMPINTGAIPEGTLDSELFGHKKGSFTSAYEERKGYFEEAEGGTIFLDEIGEMPLATQARLLRLLENGEFIKVGSSEIQKSDVRVIAATNKDLISLIQEGKFRQDLYFRLNRITIYIPPLRERGSDIELLFNYFSHEFADQYNREALVLAPSAVPLLHQYRWPGNVRELRNLVEKLVLLVKGEWVSEEDLKANLLIQDSYLPSIVHLAPEDYRSEEAGYVPPGNGNMDRLYQLIYNMGNELSKEIADLKKVLYMSLQNRELNNGHVSNSPYPSYPVGEQIHEPKALPESLSLDRKQREMIVKALQRHGNNRKKAAADLGISERTLYRKIKNYDIDL